MLQTLEKIRRHNNVLMYIGLFLMGVGTTLFIYLSFQLQKPFTPPHPYKFSLHTQEDASLLLESNFNGVFIHGSESQELVFMYCEMQEGEEKCRQVRIPVWAGPWE